MDSLKKSKSGLDKAKNTLEGEMADMSAELKAAMASKQENERRRKQQLGAAAVVLFGVLYDFFITHHGVGFWDPNYVV